MIYGLKDDQSSFERYRRSIQTTDCSAYWMARNVQNETTPAGGIRMRLVAAERSDPLQSRSDRCFLTSLLPHERLTVLKAKRDGPFSRIRAALIAAPRRNPASWLCRSDRKAPRR